MPSLDIGTFPDGLIREMLVGIVEEEESLVDKIFGRQIRDLVAMSGEIPRDGTESGVARGDNQALKPGVEAEEGEGEVDTVSYNARAYVGEYLTPEEVVATLAYYGEEGLARDLRAARRDANTALDRKVFGTAGILASTSLNNERDATSAGGGPWSDSGSNSNPVKDIRYAKQTGAPGADTVIVGLNPKNSLMIHSDVLADKMYFGGAGTDNEEGLENWFKRKFGFRNVFFIEKLFNSAAKTKDPSLSYIGENLVWIGYHDDLCLVHPRHQINDQATQERVQKRRSWRTQFVRYDDAIRPTKEKGVVVTNVQT